AGWLLSAAEHLDLRNRQAPGAPDEHAGDPIQGSPPERAGRDRPLDPLSASPPRRRREGDDLRSRLEEADRVLPLRIVVEGVMGVFDLYPAQDLFLHPGDETL